MCDTDVQGKFLIWHKNYIHNKRQSWDKEPPNSNLPLNYLIDTVSLEWQDRRKRSNGQTPRRLHFLSLMWKYCVCPQLTLKNQCDLASTIGYTASGSYLIPLCISVKMFGEIPLCSSVRLSLWFLCCRLDLHIVCISFSLVAIIITIVPTIAEASCWEFYIVPKYDTE